MLFDVFIVRADSLFLLGYYFYVADELN